MRLTGKRWKELLSRVDALIILDEEVVNLVEEDETNRFILTNTAGEVQYSVTLHNDGRITIP